MPPKTTTSLLNFRTRLVLVHLAVIITVLTVAAFAAHLSLSRAVHGQLDAALLALAETEISMLAEKGPVKVHDTTAGPAPPSLMRLDRLVQIIDANGQVLARSVNLGAAKLPVPPELLSRLAEGDTVFETLPKFGEEPVRMVSMPIRVDNRLMAIQVAGSLDDTSHVVDSASILFIIMALTLIVAVGVAGVLLTRRVFNAIDNIVREAHHIGEANFAERLPHPGTSDEIGRLVDTLNEMLDRLQQSFEVQRRFTADASHELRSPLSRLRMELEVTLRRPREPADYIQALHSCMEEVERLSLLVEELLTLARIDAGQERNTSEVVCLNQLVDEAASRMEAIASERAIRIRITPSPEVMARVARGSASLVIANLLDNAVKFSRHGGNVVVTLADEGGMVSISVSDTGPGINREELPHLFERFYRGTSTRAEETPGVGLGLALSQSIAHVYGGRIEVASSSQSSQSGTQFTFKLPKPADLL